VPTLLLLLATLTTGLTTGAYVLYAHTVMPGLRRTDDRTFVSGFQALDRAVINPWFMAGGFFGAPVLMAAAAATHLSEAGRPVLPWVVIALVLDLVTIAITIGVNVPRNDRLKAAGEADAVDVEAVRAEFGERTWARWNLVRVVLSLAAFACLTWALVVAGGVRASTEASSRSAVPATTASSRQVLGAWVRAVEAGDCKTERALSTSTVTPGNGALCGRVEITAARADVYQPSLQPSEVTYATGLAMAGGGASLPDGEHLWFTTLRQQPGGEWRLVDGGSGR